MAMRRVLKPTGSIYLHCDATASHYLKLALDHIFGPKNFRREIVWHLKGAAGFKAQAPNWIRGNDIILYYVKSPAAVKGFNKIWLPYDEKQLKRFSQVDEDGRQYKSITKTRRLYLDEAKGVPATSVWSDIASFQTIVNSKEILGYPTQKPQTLYERMINASCPPDGVVLDPFCGCGTTVHAAEELGRRWIGIDISSFATGLVRDRIVKAFPQLEKADISLLGNIPKDAHSARTLAQRDSFEFEKWVCGHIGAEGMYKNLGAPGADGGVDGVMKFFPVRPDKKWRAEYAIVQVKGGHVTPDAVRALRETVDRFEVTAGVLVCFDQYMSTVDNQRSRETFSDALGTYPVIQGYSVENLLVDAPLNLPLYGFRRQGALLTA